MNYDSKFRILISNSETEGSMSTRGVVSVEVLKIFYAVIGMLYWPATFQDLLLTIQVRF